MLNRALKLILALIVFIPAHNQVFCQAFQKENPISFVDFFIGPAIGNAGGFSLGLGINYQVNRSFFTARALGTVKFGGHNPDSYYSAPFFNVKNSMGELALLYGLREIKSAHAYSFSLGASYNRYFKNGNDDTYLGLPFEANIKWFNREKKRPRILFGLIPVGEPTGFSESFGFKLFGNVSRQSYVGIGLSSGIGYHKVYD